MAAERTPARSGGAAHPSPPLLLLAAVHAVLVVVSLAVTPLRWSAFLQLGAAVPLGIFAATAASRLHFLGVRAAGATIALFGGAGAALLLAVAAAAQWTAAWPEVAASAPTVRALELLGFAIGGPAHVALLGLLVAGLAVTAGVHRLVPAWLMPAGLVLAALAELSWLSLVFPAASVLLPIARFPALAWLVAVGALLPRRSGRAAAERGAVPLGAPRDQPAT